MTRREIATLACKILALWLFAQVVLFATSLLMMALVAASAVFNARGFHGDQLITAAYGAVVPLGMLILGLVFWFRASRIAGRMVSDDPAAVTRPDLTQADVMTVAFSAIGVFTLVAGLGELVSSFTPIAQNTITFSQWWSSPVGQARFWSSIIVLAFALALIFGSRGLARLVLWARSAGEPQASEPPAASR